MSLRLKAIKKNADIWPTYDKVLEMKKVCTPHNIIYKDDEVISTIGDNVYHQLTRLLSLHPDFVEEMKRVKELGGETLFYYKFGGGND